MKIGCHVSIAGGVFNAPGQAAELGCEVFQMFTRSPQGGPAPVLGAAAVEQFQAAVQAQHQAAWVVHTPYYINFASSNPRIQKGSAAIIREELERATKLGAAHLMTHLGSAKDVTPAIGQRMVVDGLRTALDGYTGTTIFCIENSAGAGSTIGSRFEDIGAMIVAIEKDRSRGPRVGVCLDTCHAFASGYDLRTPTAVKQTLAGFDKYIGLDRLLLIHANDSKFGFGGAKDRHQHIGQGHIGLAGFRAMAKHPVLKRVNWYLETESDGVRKDIATLKKIRG